MSSRTININGLGPVLLERSRRARRLIISLKPFNTVRVAVPHNYSYALAEEVVSGKLDWIKKNLARMKSLELEHAALLEKMAEIDRYSAKRMLMDRVKELAAKYDYNYQRVTVRSQKTRWGSCSVKNNISLNIKLSLLPAELTDYVIVHELVHTRFKNHGVRFWRELEKIVPDVRELRVRLNDYALVLL